MSADSTPFLHDPSFLMSDAPVQAAASSATDLRAGDLLRVLHLINGEHYAGAERVQDLLALRLPAHGFEVGFACLKPGRFSQLRQSQHAPLAEIPMTTKLSLGVAKQLCALVKQDDYQIVHAHTPRSCMVARIVGTLARVPVVYHIHSPTLHDSTRSWANRVNAWIERLSLTGVAQMIAVSESLAQHMCSRGYNPNLISIVPNGVPRRDELPPRQPPADKWVLGTVALFRPRKGIEVLIDALSTLRGYGYDVSLRAVGVFESAAYEASIRAQVAKLRLDDVVHWTGFTQDVDAELTKMDLLVLPSLFGEGLPMVILEAMAAGVPVVATRVEGAPEVLRDGQYGVIAAPGCANDLARSIRRVIRGEVSWSELRTNAHTRQSELFSDHSMAAGVAAAYRRVLTKVGKRCGKAAMMKTAR